MGTFIFLVIAAVWLIGLCLKNAKDKKNEPDTTPAPNGEGIQVSPTTIIIAVILVAAIVAGIFWTMVFIDGEDMFVIGAVISSCVLVVAADVFFTYEFYAIAKEKGYDERKYFWYSLLFGIIGFLLIAALPDRNSSKNN